MAPLRRPRHWGRWLIAGVVVLLLIVVGGPFIYFHFIEGSSPAKLTLPKAKAGTTSAAVPLAGTWAVTTGSTAGYRIQENLFGQSHTAVGRTTAVTGQMTATAIQVTNTTVTVDLTKVSSDSGERDSQFQGRIMNTSQFPTATFTLTSPINLGTVPTAGTTVAQKASGTLAMHGTTRAIQVDLSSVQTGNVIQVNGSIPVTFSDFGISNPSGGPATTGSTGTIEFLVAFQHR
jgi:polyisoprenoid-binding protein YceI